MNAWCSEFLLCQIMKWNLKWMQNIYCTITEHILSNIIETIIKHDITKHYYIVINLWKVNKVSIYLCSNFLETVHACYSCYYAWHCRTREKLELETPPIGKILTRFSSLRWADRRTLFPTHCCNLGEKFHCAVWTLYRVTCVPWESSYTVQQMSVECCRRSSLVDLRLFTKKLETEMTHIFVFVMIAPKDYY